MCKRAGRKVGVQTRLRHILSARAKLITYKSAILPQLTFCHIVWNFCCSSDNRKLEPIQERPLRAIYNRKSGTYDELLKLAKLPTLKNRQFQDIAIPMCDKVTGTIIKLFCFFLVMTRNAIILFFIILHLIFLRLGIFRFGNSKLMHR